MKAVEDRAQLTEALRGKKVTALFHATWCPFCRSFRPVFDRVAGARTGGEHLEVLLDDEDNPLWTEFDVEIVPTVLFFEDGTLVGRLDGKAGVGLTEALLREAMKG